MKALAINVGANTNIPGFRGRIGPDGRFDYVPIPEREPTREPVPTYGDLSFAMTDTEDVEDVPIHLDPAFPAHHGVTVPTYGDEHGVKAGRIASLGEGDRLYFYATLRSHGPPGTDWIVAPWGAYLIGVITLGSDPLEPDDRQEVPPALHCNAHVKRETFDARVLVRGDPDQSTLFDIAVPLSGEDGADAGPLVTDHSSDSGAGPWWRRPLAFDDGGVDAIEDSRQRVTE